ncbi:HipA domain-containing protein [Herbiconiux sp. 11R-BC]|uniref:type II toxin-antitoxin system HipA family toxin n=1 Tax=Herbiconiux sp. 11R-BC TaxID=3111637 RepID=UPI003BFC77A0
MVKADAEVAEEHYVENDAFVAGRACRPVGQGYCDIAIATEYCENTIESGHRDQTTVTEFDGLPALVIERYDRSDGRRVHQEDFSQALGASGNEKYEQFGGAVSLKRVATTLVESTSADDLMRLARMVVLAVGIGNLDMHTKNIGLVHTDDGAVTLAPAYDVVPQAHMPNDGMLALAVNKKYRHSEITRDDLLAELSGWGLRNAARTVNDTLEELQSIVKEESELDGAALTLQDRVAVFVDNLLYGSPAGGRAD